MADEGSVKRRVAELRKQRPHTARDGSVFNSQLATASGFTNTGEEATRQRELTMAAAAAREAQEVEELKELLARTSYTGGGNSYKRAGNVATADPVVTWPPGPPITMHCTQIKFTVLQ